MIRKLCVNQRELIDGFLRVARLDETTDEEETEVEAPAAAVTSVDEDVPF